MKAFYRQQIAVFRFFWWVAQSIQAVFFLAAIAMLAVGDLPGAFYAFVFTCACIPVMGITHREIERMRKEIE